jgi:predicted metalloprotease with PDZ domain
MPIKEMDGEIYRNYNQCYWLREGFEDYYRYLINDLETCLKYIKENPE